MTRRARLLLSALVCVGVVGVIATLVSDDAPRVGTSSPTTASTSGEGSQRPDSAAGGSSSSESSASTEASTTTRAEATEPVTFVFGGDVHFEGFLRTNLDANPDGVLDAIEPMLASADVAMINLETAIGSSGPPAPKEYVFQAPPTAFRVLVSAGVDVVSMANNHGMDHGVEGLQESIGLASEAGFPVVGIGNDAAAAYTPWVTEVRGVRVAVIGATQVLDSALIEAWTAGPGKPGLASAKEVAALTDAVRAARADSDIVVVHLHWGVEGQTCPSVDQQTLAEQLVDAGADVIVGGHAHRVQGAGRLDGALVAYGLGNFVFYSTSGDATTSGVLQVTMRGRTVEAYDWIPARLQNGVATALSGADAANADASWESLRGCTGLDA